jgi:hypothetical protein
MSGVLLGALLGDGVAPFEAQRHAAVQVDLDAAAEVHCRIVVLAGRIVVADDAHAPAADQHEGTHYVVGTCKSRCPRAAHTTAP